MRLLAALENLISTIELVLSQLPISIKHIFDVILDAIEFVFVFFEMLSLIQNYRIEFFDLE